MDQTQEPIKTHHQPSEEEEEHHENGASKMFRKVKAKARKIKNSLTNHGQSHEQDHDVVDEDDELEPEAIGAPVRSGVTSQPESLNHNPREANVPATEEIIPPGTKVFPVVSPDYTNKPIELVPLQDVSYEPEASPHSVRTTDVSDKEEKREAPVHHPLSELSDREERREAHHDGLNTPVSLLSATEDVTGTFAPGGEDEYLGGQRKVNFEAPKKFEDDSAVTGGGSQYLSGDVSDYQSKVTDPTKEGSGEAKVLNTTESLSKMKETDQYSDKKSGSGFETDFLDKEERREAPIQHPPSELSDREERREAHNEGLNAPVSLLSATEDVTGTFAPGGEDEYHGEHRKDEVETPKVGSKYRTGDVSDYQSKIASSTKEGSGEAGVPDISESLSRMNVSDDYSDPKSELGFERDFSARSKYFEESELGKDSPARFAGEGAELGDKFPEISHEFDQKTEFGVNESSPTRNHEFDVNNESSIDKNSPSRSHEFDLQTESGVDNILPVGFGSDSGAELGKEFPTERREFDQKIESGRNEISPTEFSGGLGAPTGGDFPVGSHEVCLKDDSEIGKDSPTKFGRESGEDFPAKGSYEYGEQTEDYFSTRNDNVKVETELGNDVPTVTQDQFSPELSRPKERDDFEETTQETKPSTYTDQFTSVKNGVASKLGYSGGTPRKDKIEVDDGKLTPVGEKNRETESTKLPISGDGSRVEETEHGEDKGVSAKHYLSEKLKPGEEDSPTKFGRESGEDFPAKGSYEYDEQTEDYFPTRNDNVKVETELGNDVPTGTQDQFSPELSLPKERDDFEETTQETKPSIYTDQFTSVKNGVASKLGYSGGTPVKDKIEVDDGKLTPVGEKNRETESTKLPISGDGSRVEEREHVEDKGVSAKHHLSEKLTPGEEDKALSEVLAEKLKIGGGEEEKKEMEMKVEKIPVEESENNETVAEEEKAGGGGYVGMIKGWFGGGATEEVKPKSPQSVQESSQSPDTTVGTKGLSDFGGSELGETGGRGGVVSVQTNL